MLLHKSYQGSLGNHVESGLTWLRIGFNEESVGELLMVIVYIKFKVILVNNLH